jgi:HEAT repeat protein
MEASEARPPGEMFRRTRIGIASVACLAFGIACLFTLRSSEPANGGESLSRCVERLFANYPGRDSEAREALCAMGQPAVRFLAGKVDHAPSEWRSRLASMTADIPLINGLCRVATFDRLLAAKALAEIGPAAKSAIPALERAAKEDDRMLSLAARAALIRIREESIEAHIASFRQFGTTNSAHAAFLLAELGPYAMPAVPAMLESLQSTNDRVRFYGTMALARIGCETPECVPSLQRLLSDPSPLIRCEALDGLANMGPSAKTALTNIRELLQDPNRLVRAGALACFDKVLSDEEFSTVRDEVVRAKLDTDPTISQAAQYVLSRRPHSDSGDTPSR